MTLDEQIEQAETERAKVQACRNRAHEESASLIARRNDCDADLVLIVTRLAKLREQKAAEAGKTPGQRVVEGLIDHCHDLRTAPDGDKITVTTWKSKIRTAVNKEVDKALDDERQACVDIIRDIENASPPFASFKDIVRAIRART